MAKKKHRGQSASFMRSINPHLHSKKSLKGGAIMARRKKRHSRKYSNMGGKGLKGIMLGAVAYGAVRQYASNALTPLTSKIPLGTLSDEAVMGIASYLLYKKTKGLPSEIGKAGLYIELARVGEAIVSGQVGLGNIFGSSGVSSGGTANASLY